MKLRIVSLWGFLGMIITQEQMDCIIPMAAMPRSFLVGHTSYENVNQILRSAILSTWNWALFLLNLDYLFVSSKLDDDGGIKRP